jgi:signal transduction histidine kinase
VTAPADAVDPDGLRRARLAAALFEQAPAAIGAFSADGAELVTNASYRALRERGLTPVPQAPREREVALDDGAYLALRFPLEAEAAEGLQGDDGRGERAPYGEVLLDVSQRRLRAVSAALAELEQLKSDLVSTVSHELRTPLSSILGYCELLRDGEFGELDPGVRQMIDVIARNSRRLSRLLEDLLLLAQLDAPCPPPAAWACCDLVDLVTSVAGSVSARARAAGLAVEVDLPREAVWVEADHAQLRHALTNLATNAVKFSAASGTVRFRLAVDATDAILEVIDDGMGIDPEDLPRLVDRFYRTAAARDQQVQGAGIGLSVVQSVAHRHRGELELCSRPGEGTTARLRLPLRNGSRS